MPRIKRSGNMSFFDAFAPIQAPMPLPSRGPSELEILDSWPQSEPWKHPPRAWIGGWLDWQLPLIDSPNLNVWARDFRACPDGLVFSLRVRAEPEAVSIEPRANGLGRPGWFLGAEDDGRLGVRYPDGRKAATGAESSTSDIALVPFTFGVEGPDQLSVRFWMWPLPTAGQLVLVADWRSIGLEDHEASISVGDLAPVANSAKAVRPRNLGTESGSSESSWKRKPSR